MICCRTNLTDLQRRIDREKPTWRTRATNATTHSSPLWQEIKWVYLDVQRRKCAYCERRPSSWKGDYAVEHFRPKGRVDDWPPLGHPDYQHFAYAARGRTQPGYHLLAYHPLNYAAACTQCNSRLKRSYFPTAAPMTPFGADPVALCASELPYLIYPIGDHDTNPENLIEFDGILPVAVDKSGGHDTKRAEVTIALFALAAGREDVRQERSRVIETLFKDLGDRTHTNPDRRRMAQSGIRRAQSRGEEHSSCAKCFVALYDRDAHGYERARQFARYATTYLNRSVRGGLPRI